jgi:hypothetical protein
LWGAGRNGKDLAKLLLEKESFPIHEYSEESTSNQEIRLPRTAESEKGKPGNSSVTILSAHPGSSLSRPMTGLYDRPSQKKGDTFIWVCDNAKKIGKEIYGIRMQHFNVIPDILSPQILIVVNSPEERKEIRILLNKWNKKPADDFWFFT